MQNETKCCGSKAIIVNNCFVCSSCGNEAEFEAGYSKEKQLNHGRIKKKKISTFGKTKTKIKKNDTIDDDYSRWLGKQACVITGRFAKRGAGANDMHCHHIYGRGGGTNDYLQVPMMGYVHSYGNKAYHNLTNKDFINTHGLIIEDLKEYFEDLANSFKQKYDKELEKIVKKFAII